MTASKPEVTPKVANPRAFDESELQNARPGTAWDVVEIGGIDFAYLAATDLDGIHDLSRGNTAKAAQLFNRALRIDMPAKVDARDRIKTARKNGTLPEVTRKLQAELFDFDVTTIATRAPRKPAEVVAEDKPTYTRAEVEAMVAAAGAKFTTK